MTMAAKLTKVTNKIKYTGRTGLILLSILVCAYKPLDIMRPKIKTVVVDAGHGGHDAGSMYGGAKEKDVTLSIALKVGEEIQKIMPEVKVIFTRTTDEFIELHERAGIANRNNADLFISVHCNANQKTEVFGTETFSMGLNKTEGNLNVAKRENSVILLEKDYQEQYEGFDPNSPEADIYFSFLQNAFMDQSLRLSSYVEAQFKAIERNSRGVKQAPFMVLWRSKMPSILIETGFISNKAERSFLLSDAGQEQLSVAIAKAVNTYKIKIENSK